MYLPLKKTHSCSSRLGAEQPVLHLVTASWS